MKRSLPNLAKARLTSRTQRAQGLVEFALILPVILVLFLSSIELARMLAIYSSLSSASRQAARYGSVGGDNGSGTPYFLDCAGIRETARRASVLQALTITDTVVRYDRGQLTDTVGYCDSANVPRLNGGAVMAATDLSNGYRIVISVTATYRPIVPISAIPDLPITFVAARTVFNSITGPTATPYCPGVPGPFSGANSEIDAEPAAAQVDSTTGHSSNVTVTINDGVGCPIPGATVVLAKFSGPGAPVITPASTTTNPTGKAIFTVNSTTAGVVQFEATVGGSPVVPKATVTFIAGPADATVTTVTAAPASVAADGVTQSTVTVTVTDQYGNLLSGKTVSLRQTGGPAFPAPTINGSPATTNGSGVATFTVASTKAGTDEFTATVTDSAYTDGGCYSPCDVTQTASVTFVPGVPNASQSSISASPTSLTVSTTNTSQITVTLLDYFGNIVPVGTSVTLTSSRGALDTISGSPATTDANGQVFFTVKSTKSGTPTFTAAPPGLTVNVTFEPDVVNVAHSTLSANVYTILADSSSTSTVSVYLKDQFDNAIPGKTVALAHSGPGTVTPASVPTDVNGLAAFAITSGTIGTEAFQANDTTDGVNPATTPNSVTITYVTPGADPTLSTMTVAPASRPANGVAASTVTVTLYDGRGAGYPRAGKVVTLTSSRGITDTIAPASAATNGAGVATFTVKSVKVGTSTISASASDTVGPCNPSCTLVQTRTITFTPPVASAGNSSVAASPPTVTANGVMTSTITVTLRDSDNVPTAGKTVTLAKTSGPGSPTISPASAVTDSSGVATFTVKSTTSGVDVFTATDTTDGVTVTQTASVTFTPGPVDAGVSTMSAAPASVEANGVSTSTLTVTLKDANGNVVAGKTVTVAKIAGAGSPTISPASAVTNSSGVATFTVKSTTVAGNTFQATDTTDGVTVTQTAAVSFTAVQCVSIANPTGVGGGTVTYVVTNNAAIPRRLTRVVVTFTGAAGIKFDTLQFNATTIWNGNDASPVTISSFSGTSAQRTVAASPATANLVFGFSKNTTTITITTDWDDGAGSFTCSVTK